jgi:hypothetical protein
MLQIRFQDILRATLSAPCGNRGWIGFAPRGDRYHVVVPVDAQIARGVMACNRPMDGTPFGGYAGWIYFMCPPFEMEDDVVVDEQARLVRAEHTAEELVSWLAGYGIEAEIIYDREASTAEKPECASVPDNSEEFHVVCSRCGRSWIRKGELISDRELKLGCYTPCTEDFQKGEFQFLHSCGGTVTISVSEFVRNRIHGRSLAGTHACPGLCYYETSWAACKADCEGSLYRRVANKLKSR